MTQRHAAQVPHAPRDFWKQRARWAKASHLYFLDKHSVFWKRQPYMTLYQKSLYGLPLLLHFTVFFTEPIMFTLPLVCLGFDICPYGMDLWLWVSHFMRLLFTFLVSTHSDSLSKRFAALSTLTASRILYFVNVKAVVNTVMVYVRWKRPGRFKVTAKQAAGPAPPAAASERPQYVMGGGGAASPPPPLRRAQAVGEADRYSESFWEELTQSDETTFATDDQGPASVRPHHSMCACWPANPHFSAALLRVRRDAAATLLCRWLPHGATHTMWHALKFMLEQWTLARSL